MDPPGEDLVRTGVDDSKAGMSSSRAARVDGNAAASGNVAFPPTLPDPEHRLYGRLAAEHGYDTNSRYDALVGRLASYERALERASQPRPIDPPSVAPRGEAARPRLAGQRPALESGGAPS